MGKKYIIELEDKPVCVFDEDTQTFFPRLHRVKGFNSLVFDQNGLDKLTPYTEPDTEQVRKEAYENGYKTAKIQCGIQAEKDMREVGQRHYQRGLNDAWEAARKICTNWVLSDSVLSEIFGMDKTIDDIMKEITASEAIEKIRAYEQKHEKIKVGDEVIYDGERCVVVFPQTEHLCATVIDCERFHHSHTVLYGELKKTGRHFTELVEVLAKMKEAE